MSALGRRHEARKSGSAPCDVCGAPIFPRTTTPETGARCMIHWRAYQERDPLAGAILAWIRQHDRTAAEPLAFANGCALLSTFDDLRVAAGEPRGGTYDN